MGSYETVPGSGEGSKEQMRKELLRSVLKPLISDFLETLEYKATPTADHGALRSCMLKYAVSSGVPYDSDKHARQCFATGLSVAGDMYPGHPLEIQAHIGVFTWLGFLIDDTNREMGFDLALFQARFSTGQAQPTQLLGCFADVLRATYQFWDPVVANFIVLSALAFVTANTLETRQEFQEMLPHSAGASWPYHFRNIEGLPEVYTYFMFPAVRCPDISMYLQAVPDMGRFINLTNDILSFYKEEVAGETRNYMNSRAGYEGKPVMTTIKEVMDETTQAYLRATEVLSGKSQYAQAWREYVTGYVTMHLTSSRYLFKEIGLDDMFTSKHAKTQDTYAWED